MLGFAFFGEKGAGKSTIAQMVAQYNGGVKIAFADPPKREAAGIVCDVLTMARTESNIRLFVNIMNTPGEKERFRDLLRWLGPFRRDYYLSHWVDLWHRAVNEEVRHHMDGEPKSCGHVIATVDDMRYNNERERVDQLGMYVVYVTRPGTESEDAHDSESDWRVWAAHGLFDFHLDNSGTMMGAYEALRLRFGDALSVPKFVDTLG